MKAFYVKKQDDYYQTLVVLYVSTVDELFMMMAEETSLIAIRTFFKVYKTCEPVIVVGSLTFGNLLFTEIEKSLLLIRSGNGHSLDQAMELGNHLYN